MHSNLLVHQTSRVQLKKYILYWFLLSTSRPFAWSRRDSPLILALWCVALAQASATALLEDA